MVDFIEMEDELINILIPVYNAGHYLNDSIKSVLGQTYTHWRLLILDDCSTDDSFIIASGWAERDQRIRVYRNDQNLGMLGNWNKGIQLATAPYFVKLDADDIWHPEILERSIAVLRKHKDVGLVFSRYINIDEFGMEQPGSDLPLPDFARDKAFYCTPLVEKGPDIMLSYPILRQGLSVMRRVIFEEVGLYRYLLTKETQASTDTEFYFRLGAHYQIYYMDVILYKYRVHPSSISAIDKKNARTAQKMYEIKICILKYYIDKGFIDDVKGKRFLKKVQLDYDLFRIADMRQKREWSNCFRLLANHALLNPMGLFKFYLKRIYERASN